MRKSRARTSLFVYCLERFCKLREFLRINKILNKFGIVQFVQFFEFIFQNKKNDILNTLQNILSF